jgi:hypothetical protein
VVRPAGFPSLPPSLSAEWNAHSQCVGCVCRAIALGIACGCAISIKWCVPHCA